MNTNSFTPLYPIEILLVEDNPADVRLTVEALNEQKVYNNLNTVSDGAEALDYLRKKGKYANAVRPDLILLDLNLPKVDGREVLREIKSDNDLRSIPVVILTVSKSDEDVMRAYNLYANCYITKPVDFEQFMQVVKSVQDFWLSIVKLPPKPC
jgi:two-component system, chemotaxis family, response regulator Rcp1